MANFNEFAAAVYSLKPSVAVVLGSGHSNVLNSLEVASSIAFRDVPGFSAPSVAGHAGTIVAGTIGGIGILIFRGRRHFYESYSWEQVGASIRLASNFGVKTLLLTNAAGGIHEALMPGSMMAIHDHLLWQRSTTWRGPGPIGCRCPLGDRPSPYSPRLIGILREAGRQIGEEILEGIYAAVTGPSYETPAEIRALRFAEAAAVGMSTAYEVELGRSLGLECAALSCITNKAAGLSGEPLDHREVLDVAERSRYRLDRLLGAFLAGIDCHETTGLRQR